MNEVARQIISGSIGLITYFGGGRLTENLIQMVSHKRHRALNNTDRDTLMVMGGTTLSFIGYGFIRPMFSTTVLLHWLKSREHGAKQSLSAIGKTSARKIAGLTSGFVGILGLSEWLRREDEKDAKNEKI